MKYVTVAIAALLLMVGRASAQENSIDSMQVTQSSGGTIVKLTMKKALANPPAAFSVATPPRIAFDFPSTANGLGRTTQAINEGDLRSANVVQAGDRTRLVLNLSRMTTYDTRIEDKSVYISLAPLPPTVVGQPTVSHFAESRATTAHQIRGINFRRGKTGEGKVVVDLSDPSTGIDIRQQGTALIVDFLKTSVPEGLRKRLDVTDFGTPVTSVNTITQGDTVRMIVTPTGLWEHNAYQSDNQFVIEVKRVIEDPNKLVQGTRGGYKGEKLSLNFQNIDVRSVLQVIADFTNFNIITSDSVQGNLTLRLKDVPWDQALDIILQAKGLDMRKNGNVIWIAPRDELAAKEKLDLEAKSQIGDLEPLRTESFQLNYQRAEAVQALVTNEKQKMLSKRGSAVVDQRTNKLFVQDTSGRLDDLRRLIQEIDVPVRQVMIEARIVEAEDTFSKNLGARLGLNGNPYREYQAVFPREQTLGGTDTTQKVTFYDKSFLGGSLAETGFFTGQIETKPDFFRDALNVDLRAGGIAGRNPGQIALSLFNKSRFGALNLEISALEADGKGKIVSSPRVVTADGVEALIEQGVEIPYQQATSSGATSISFRKANLSLKVKPN
ncbi:MAG: type IV pilus secretin PilQ, partial [Sterolibacteriaceae bacterium]|nr:type IV pilus secretin PilQ [Candidatus Methylophosphatis haderslevensis]